MGVLVSPSGPLELGRGKRFPSLVQESKSIEGHCSLFTGADLMPGLNIPGESWMWERLVHIPEIRSDASCHIAGWRGLVTHQVVGREERGRGHRLVPSRHVGSKLILAPGQHVVHTGC